MVDKDTVLEKISALKRHVLRLKEISRFPRSVFVENQDLQQLAAFNLQMAVQNCIDIGNHIFAEMDIGAPGNYSEIFHELVSRKVITKKMLEDMIKMIGLRNRIAHDYEDIDQEKIYQILKKDLKSFDFFINQLVKKYNI